MADGKNLESWLRRAGESEEIRESLRRAEAGPAPSDVLLARYQAGMLAPEDAERVGNQALFSAESHRRLVLLHEDAEGADLRSRPESRAGLAFRTRISEAFAGLFAPRAALAFATGAAALAVVLAGVEQLGNRPPGFPSDPYMQVTDGSKGVERLPDGTTLAVDDAWTLFVPSGEVERVEWFVWQPAHGAASYALRLLGPAGEVLFSRSGLERSRARLPREERSLLRPRREYVWVVEAAGAEGALLSRGVARFRIEPR